MCSSVFLVSTRFLVFFFFKQKTAYEMRISDWSSDVCSSDLLSRDEGSLAPTRDRKEGSWWALTGSNRRPSRCKRDALPTELSAPPDVAISGRCALPHAAATGKRSCMRGQTQQICLHRQQTRHTHTKIKR